MGYYYIDEEDGYIREFDNNKKFIPNENVAAFAAGPGFDWSVLKQSGSTQSSSDDDYYVAPKTTKASSSTNVVPASVRRAAEEYAMANREQAVSKGIKEIRDNANDMAKEAYVSYRKEEKLIPKEMADSGIYSGTNKHVGKSFAKYQEALGIIKKNMEEWTAKLNSSAETQEEKDIKEYIARWKEQRG